MEKGGRGKRHSGDLSDWIFTGIAAGASVITAKYWGAQDVERVQSSIENALAPALAGGVLMIPGQLLARQALIWLNTPEDILTQAVIYIKIYLLAGMSMIMYNMRAGIMCAKGDSRTDQVRVKCVFALTSSFYSSTESAAHTPRTMRAGWRCRRRCSR